MLAFIQVQGKQALGMDTNVIPSERIGSDTAKQVGVFRTMQCANLRRYLSKKSARVIEGQDESRINFREEIGGQQRRLVHHD